MRIAKEISEIYIELQKIPAWAKNVILVFSASLLLGLCSRISIPLPFTVVPIVIQNTLVLLLAVLVGSKRATAAVAVFLAQGAMGLPVFAGGLTGLNILIGPRCGYFLGYLLAAFVVGKIMELAEKRTMSNAFLAMFVGNVVIFVCGAFVLSFFIGGMKAFQLGVLPFLIGDAVKLAVCLKFLQWIGWAQKDCKSAI